MSHAMTVTIKLTSPKPPKVHYESVNLQNSIIKLCGGSGLTTLELLEYLPDYNRKSLSYHLTKLSKKGVLKMVKGYKWVLSSSLATPQTNPQTCK